MKLSTYLVSNQTLASLSIHLVLAWISTRMIAKRWCSLSVTYYWRSVRPFPSSCLCMYVCMHAYQYEVMNSFLFIGGFWCRLSPFWPVRATSGCRLCPFDMCSLSFECSLTYVVRHSQPSLGINHFSRELWSGFFLWIFINGLN